MDILKKHIKAIFIFFIPLYAYGYNVGTIPTGVLPEHDWWEDVAWEDSGQWVTQDVTLHGLLPNNEVVDASQVVQQLVDGAVGKTVIYFPPGKYYFKNRIIVSKSDIVFQGAGPTESFLYFDAPKLTVGRVGSISFLGNYGSNTYNTAISTLGTPPLAGDNQITVSNVDTLSIGDWIHVYADYNGDYSATGTEWGKIVRITDINNRTLTVDKSFSLDFSFDNMPKVRRIDFIEYVAVRDLYLHKTSNSDDDTITFFAVNNGLVSNIKSYMTSRYHVRIQHSVNVEVTGSEFSHSYDYGGGGHGYGVAVDDSASRNLVVNNKLHSLRHSFIWQRGASFNVFAYNDTTSDKESKQERFHGNYAYMNLVEGNIMRSEIAMDSAHGINGEKNIVYRNVTPKITGGQTYPFVIVGNSASVDTNSNQWRAANKSNNSVNWENMNSTDSFPNSLYTSTKPGFLDGFAWPPFGPGALDFGDNNGIPASSISWPIEEPVSTEVGESFIIDNRDAEINGAWSTSSYKPDHYNSDYLYISSNGSGSNWVKFRLNNIVAGDYSVYYWLPGTSSTYAPNARFQVWHNGTYTNYYVNQTNSPVGSWVLLGSHYMSDAATGNGVVQVYDEGSGDYIVVDAIRFVRN